MTPSPCHTLKQWPKNPYTKLPKIIHHQWRNETILRIWNKTYESQLKYFPAPEFTHILWTDEKFDVFFKKNYHEYVDAVNAMKEPVNKIDAARCFILHYYGGVYVDLDYLVKEDFFERLPDDAPGIIESPYRFDYEDHQNSLMSSPAGHPFWNVTFKFIKEAPNVKKWKISIWTEPAGPIMLDRAMKEFKGKTYTLPCENFQRYPRFHLNQIYILNGKQCGFRQQGCELGVHMGTACYGCDKEGSNLNEKEKMMEEEKLMDKVKKD